MRFTLALLGWLIVAFGALSEAVYHIPNWFFGVQWGPTIETFGEFGHTVVFVGIVVLVYDILRRHPIAR